MSAIEELAARAGAALMAAGSMLATAESCTGGWVAQALTSVPGASQWFDRGFVCYSNASKRELLGVSARTLARAGAVSEAVAHEMALGALARSRAQVALAVTGIAGPSGGSPRKPVGTVCLAWAMREGAARSETQRYAGEREEVRRQAVERALAGLIELLQAAR